MVHGTNRRYEVDVVYTTVIIYDLHRLSGRTNTKLNKMTLNGRSNGKYTNIKFGLNIGLEQVKYTSVMRMLTLRKDNKQIM